MKTRRLLLCAFLTPAILFADTTDWMSRIPPDRVFNQLIIPGTHDSGTYAISANSNYALTRDDPLPQWYEKISNWFPAIFSGIAAGWAKTQPDTILQQLNAGIRYLDF